MLRNYSKAAAALRVRRANRSQGAFDLTELALYLVAGILLLIGIIALFESVFGSTKAQTAQSQFNTVVTEVRSLYGNQPTYSGLTTAIIANSGAMAAAWLDSAPPSATTILNPWHGAISVAPNSANTAFVLTDKGLPTNACVAIATQDEGSGFQTEAINGGTATTTVPAAATAQTSCSSAGSGATGNTVAITLN
jgi:major structural subunit of bundle-forming pilus